MPENTQTEKTDAPLVSIDHASVRISRRNVLRAERFSIHQGEHWCVFGGNGAGKTLLARLLRGELVTGRQHVNYAPQFDPVRDVVTVSFEEQQRLWALENRHDISEFEARAEDAGTTVRHLICPEASEALLNQETARSVLERLNLEGLLDRGIRFLSSGQIRKVLIARVLLGQGRCRRLLILDDPLEALDRDAQPAVRSLLQQQMTAANATLLLCRREEEILPGITHLAIMEGMQIVAQGPRAQVISTKAYRQLTQPDVELSAELPIGGKKSLARETGTSPIRLDKVNAGYGENRVLENLTWEMGSQHHTLIEGPNGCGKSTLLSLIDGENHKAYGQNVFLFGRRRGSGESVWDIKAHFGVVSNEIHNRYVRGWKVIDVIVSGFFDSVGLYDDSGASQIETATRWLEVFAMAPLAKAYFHEISFGQQRLVLIARAMVKEPDVLILDEPCVGLDDRFRLLVLKTLDRIVGRSSTQLIYVSHTRDEEPACINQRLRFVEAEPGRYRLCVRDGPTQATGQG